MVIVSACGGKSQESVVKKIEKKLADVSGYKAVAEMTMKTGREDRQYHINVMFQKGKVDLYRVDLASNNNENKQVILKNAEGVFVLTPLLNKSFKFQADWPEKSAQPYLYQSLVQDVLADVDAVFTTTDTHYIFRTKTNYQHNKNLPYQKIHFDKKTLQPVAVHVMDKDEQVLMEVRFSEMEMNPSFSADDFDRESILKVSEEESTTMNVGNETEMEVLFPLVTMGAELVEKSEVPLDDGNRVIMTFKGERNFTFIQETMNSLPASTQETEMNGELVHLGHSIGAITDNAIEWTHAGTKYYLASEEMTMDELIEVAASVQGKEVK